MAIPLAVDRRLDKGESRIGLWAHVLARYVSLVVLGLLLANADKVDESLTGMTGGVWALLGLAGALLFWHVYPRDCHKVLYRLLRYGGLLLLIAVLAIFRRRTPDGAVVWLDLSYWEILGLIGQAYLAAAILYVPFRQRTWAPMVFLAGLYAMCVGSLLGFLNLSVLPRWIWPYGAGQLPAIVMAGVVASRIFLNRNLTSQRKIAWAIGYAVILFGVGSALLLFGISKVRATPAWCLYSSGISLLVFLGLYWIIDERRWTRWAGFLKPAGSNTLLTYLVPYFLYFGVGEQRLSAFLGPGCRGIALSVVMAAFFLWVSGVLTARKVRLQL